MVKLEDNRKILLLSILFFLLANILDVASSEACNRLIPGCVESNLLMRDPITEKFIMLKAVGVKAVITALLIVPVSGFLWLGFRSYLLASLVWWAAGIIIMKVASENVVITLFAP